VSMSEEDKSARRMQLIAISARFPDLVFATLPLKMTYNHARIPIYLREPGCWGSLGFGGGKTIAIRFIRLAIIAEFPGQAVYVVDEQILPGNELRSFFVRGLEETGHAVVGMSTSDKLRNRLASVWAERARLSPLQSVILLLDEAQAIREADEMMLKDLSNRISSEGGALQVISFGESPAFDTLVAKRRKKPNGAFDRLFGGHRIQICGYVSQADWDSLFEEMATALFESLGGKSVYQAFFQDVDFSNFDYRADAAAFYKSLRTISKDKGKPNLRRIFLGINFALFSYAMELIEKPIDKFTGVPERLWLAGLMYGALAKK